jgi:hypothetical protein
MHVVDASSGTMVADDLNELVEEGLTFLPAGCFQVPSDVRDIRWTAGRELPFEITDRLVPAESLSRDSRVRPGQHESPIGSAEFPSNDVIEGSKIPTLYVMPGVALTVS